MGCRADESRTVGVGWAGRSAVCRWIDSVAGLLIVGIVLHEGVDTVIAANHPDFDGCACCVVGDKNIGLGPLALRQLRQLRGITGSKQL
eukprot:4757844-Pyramimonas_sp.AAC.1